MIESHTESCHFRVHHLGLDGVDEVLREVMLMPLVDYGVANLIPHIQPAQPGPLEMELVITYQKTAEQIANVRGVNSAIGATGLLSRMLRYGETYIALFGPVNIANAGFLENIIRVYYYEHPLDTVILPETSINLYPSGGGGNLRIASIEMDFGVDGDTFLRQRNELREAAAVLRNEVPGELTVPQQIIWLSYALSERVFLTADEALLSPVHTAYGALVRQTASSAGLARGLQALLALLEIESFIILGELDDVPHAWNLVYIDGYYYHIDVSMLQTLGANYALFVSDEIMIFGNGYSWDVSEYSRADSGLRYVDFALPV